MFSEKLAPRIVSKYEAFTPQAVNNAARVAVTAALFTRYVGVPANPGKYGGEPVPPD